MTLVVGLTGNIASGKSTVARLLSERGAAVIDADVLARRAVEAGTVAHQQIVERWGADVIAADGGLDRAALRRRVFKDPAQLRSIECHRPSRSAAPTQSTDRRGLRSAATGCSSVIRRCCSSGA